MKKLLIVGILCLGLALGWPVSQLAQAAPEATCTSNGTGNWTTITWTGCASGPQAGDTVVIAAGNTVTLDTSPPTLASLTVNGTLTFGNNTTGRTLIVSGGTTIIAGGTINISNNNAGHAFSLGGNLTNSGTFYGYQNNNRYIDVTFIGPGQQTLTGNLLTMRNLTVNFGARVVFPATNLPAVNGTMTVNSGGAVQQKQTVNNGTFNFLQISGSVYRGVDLITANNLGDTTVVITTTVAGGCTSTGVSSPPYATRCYSITPTNNAAATVRLYALTSELNTITLANLRVYRYTGSVWQQLTPNGTPTTTGSYSYATADTPGFSPFLLGGTTAPTAVTLTAFDAQPQTVTWLLPVGLLLAVCAFLLLIRRRTH